MPQFGTNCITEGGLPLEINGNLRSGIYEIPGNISSQYISGLIFALPMLGGDSEIRVIGDLQSADYVEMTLQVVKSFGVEIEKTEWGFKIPGNQKYKGGEFQVEGDHSNAAFWFAADAVGSQLEITGLEKDSAQGDKKAMEILAGGFAETEIDCSDIPDIVPILSVAATASGTSRSVAPITLGIDIRNANLTACSLLNLLERPPTIVAPDLDIPGQIAIA